ncbi:TonB-dependent receptor [Sandaracinobacter sp. RS1-74]|uniref:TonB-dependent receptor n=1 Tax=Sandaracinobacteroides sayramensis TaxID=2913411 RepID=UPI001EDB6F0A|nr:TonB-dependent receptor [Sandaracinobacteroides sayramensis]MCG2842078.1 TonB-dependent receptor [Sandaracinobacteroides sayramensis]
MTKVKLAFSVSAWALALAPLAPAMAQGAPSIDEGDIVVTAQKREQRLLDVPVSITAVTSEALTTQAMNRMSDFYDRVPGLQYAGQRVSFLSLRGITSGGATSPTVALLIDDVQFGGSTTVGNPPLPDFDASAISRVEVLRGPQGTLYGASSLGGLIKYVLREPSTDEFSGRLEAGGTTVSGGGQGYSLRGSMNVPLTDWLAVAGSAFYREDAPYLDNAHPNALKETNVNTRKVWGFRAAALARPTEALTINLSALRQKMDAVNSDLAITSAGVPVCNACTPATRPGAATAPTTFEPVYGDLTIYALDSYNEATFAQYSGRVEYDFGAAALTSITAWSKVDNVISNDVTTTFPFLPPAFSGPAGSAVQIADAGNTRKFSQELRLAGDTPWFSWLLGGFYTVEHSSTDQTLFLLDAGGSLINTPYAATGPGSYREHAAFADITWHVTEKLDVQLGGRLSGNKQERASVYVVDPIAARFFGPSRSVSATSSDSAFTWLVSPSYKFSDDIMAYIRIASGYRPGGANIGSVSANATFGPDRVVNYELGFKGRVLPALTLTAAAFQIDWEDIQLQGTDSSNLTYIGNGGKARSRGLEVQGTITPWTGMSIDGNFTVTEAVLTEDLPALGASSLVGKKGDRLPFSAKFTTSVSAQQGFDLSDRLTATLGGTFTHLGERAAAFNVATGTRPRILIPSYSTVSLQGGLTLDAAWSATLFVRNLFDERGISVAQNRNGVNVPTALFIQPRTFGLTLARNF